tara:strand:+ start:955 stop:1281 length:327 start_codon:yes stop_codon:yes gene_type:complete
MEEQTHLLSFCSVTATGLDNEVFRGAMVLVKMTCPRSSTAGQKNKNGPDRVSDSSPKRSALFLTKTSMKAEISGETVPSLANAPGNGHLYTVAAIRARRRSLDVRTQF